MSDAEQVTAKVLSKAGSLLFEGLLADAEKYVADHFPRPHVDNFGNSEPDYSLVKNEPEPEPTDSANEPQDTGAETF